MSMQSRGKRYFQTSNRNEEFEVSLRRNKSLFWVVVPCNLVGGNQRFEGHVMDTFP